MTLASKLTRRPIPFEPEAAGAVKDRFASLPGDLQELVISTAAGSPYLRGLMLNEADWLEGAFEAPEAAVEAEISGLSAVPLAQLGSAQRRAKRRVALMAALADLGGAWPLMQVTGALSDLADAAVDTALRALVAAEVKRGKLPEHAGPTAGIVVLAMGKMGAGELNYSSDIDLISLFDESQYDADEFGEVRAACVRVTRRMAALIGEKTGEGYVFRTDLRLRPDPSVTPVCVAMEAAERYYESIGRTWERAAHIKARPCGGDLEAGAAYLDRLRPFVWRRHLDFAAIEDAHAMRQAIRDHKGLYGATLEGFDMKLGRGGIREIEFFTQTRQIIAGGRDESLRVRPTMLGLDRLAAKNWVTQETADLLKDHYIAHRTVEHRLQMVNDAQTHALPKTPEGFDRIARLSGQGDTEAFRREISERLEAVAGLAEGFFAPRPAGEQAQPAPEHDLDEHPIVERWTTYPALRSDRAVAIFERLKPDLLSRLAAAPRPEEALGAFDGFLRGLPAGVQLFSLFQANPELLGLIVDIAATAPTLAKYLSRNASVLDGVIAGDFFADWPGPEALQEALNKQVATAPDYEAKLDAARRWTKEWHFRVGVHLLRGIVGGVEAGRQYADLADVVLGALLPVATQEVSRRHGPPPGKGAAILGMGALGAGRMSATSDLDLIVIYDACGETESAGARPLATRAYYARLTQTLITALSAPMSQGRLYEVDMRLRPSGRQGPVAVSLESFETYQRGDAWLWEHRALTRARCVTGPAELTQAIGAVRESVLSRPRKPAELAQDAADMRARLGAAGTAGKGVLQAKLGPGMLQDIELFAQSCALAAGRPISVTAQQLAAGAQSGWITAQEAEDLTETHGLLARLQACTRLLGGESEAETGPGRALILRETGAADMSALLAQMSQLAAQADRIISHALTQQGAKAP
ncbi:bifunctional [glutamine synthetase] adenylyltransferase/[glutamine synthetase]-adenylyl-L-tyrosine phosphorylase [Alphaproteobacteria bacterium KMM 3653]|uniref:Bifunctional [glutamine synthetase] adenylyltransferase/[glutamine synthetase]-adenylyl-L-tyrosine phosphorylase n=1 Tax=Harenicola maris TaxID=2841044 RepID=A0AAP2G3E4_9RHOB|nr:bifunctional [glutamine synthetase] adenylyltransferase/[glutamine synthetase]-adenylyl-L-tyrosine phosphorylase [Harenicola maris]